MSWDIVLLNSTQHIESIEDLDESLLTPTDFCSALELHFKQVVIDGKHREVIGKDFTIDYFHDDAQVSNKVISLYGENGLYALVELAKKTGWQIFDTGLGQMLDLDNPSNNGFANYHRYLQHVLRR